MTPEDKLQLGIQSIETIIKSIGSHVENQTHILQFALWNVGVAAPGLLGVVGNLNTIKTYSRLPSYWLTVSYLVGQGALILSILIAIAIYRRTNKQLARLETARL